MRLIVYRDAIGEWRWTLKAANGRTVADSGEGYKRLASCRRMADKIAAARITVEVQQ